MVRLLLDGFLLLLSLPAQSQRLDVQALQQNGVQTLLILIVFFGLVTLTLWLLFPFRLGRKRASQG